MIKNLEDFHDKMAACVFCESEKRKIIEIVRKICIIYVYICIIFFIHLLIDKLLPYLGYCK